VTRAVPPSIFISPAVVAKIAYEARASSDGTETGGILLGTTRDNALAIRHAGDPGPQAVRDVNFFQRDLCHAQSLGDWAFEHDQSIWLGEWHTHLNAPPVPSSRDLATYRNLLADPELAFEHFVAIIVADPTNSWTHPEAATWVITKTQVDAITLQSL
jgi:integrative and conjugative element protein (TIGR02256 family)